MDAYRTNTIDRAGRFGSEYEVLMQWADFFVALKETEYARQYYIKASTLAPWRGEAHVGLGVVSLQQNDLSGAQAAFETACRLDSRSEKGFCGLGIVHQQKADYHKALSMFSRCLELNGDNMTAMLGLFEASHRVRRMDEIRYFLQRYLARHPQDIAIMLCLASVYLRAEQFGAARRVLADVLILDADNMTAVGLMEELDHISNQLGFDSVKEMYLLQPDRA